MTSINFVNRAGRVSGAEVMMLRLIDVALARGHRVCVICPDGELVRRLPADVGHIPIEEMDLGGSVGYARLKALMVLLRRWRRAAAAIRRTTDTNATVVVNSLMALPAARLARVRGGVSWLVHDTISDAQQKTLIRVARSAIRRAVAVSRPTADSVRPLGVPVVVSPQGVDIPPIRTGHVPGDPPVVGIMGVLTPWKGHRVLLQALAKLPGIRCEIAGSAFHADRAYADELRQLATEQPLAGRVSFLGHVEPVPTIRRWDVLVSASTLPEAGPIVALEAMSLGVPVIGTDHGGCAWLLRGEAGVLVPPGDADALANAIQSTLDGSVDVEAMVQRARLRVVSEHDADETYPAMLDALLAT